jgi:hypothetical protein
VSTPFYRTPALPEDIKAYLASVGPTWRAGLGVQQPAAPVAPMAAGPQYEQLAALQPRPAMALPSVPQPQQPPGQQYSQLAALRQPPPLALPAVPAAPPEEVAANPYLSAQGAMPTVSAPQNVPAPVARASGNAQPAPPSSEENDGLPGAGVIGLLAAGGVAGGAAEAMSGLGNRNHQRNGLQQQTAMQIGNIAGERRANLRERAAKAEAAEKEAAAKALQAEMDDPSSERSRMMQGGQMGALAKSVGLDPAQFSATQLVEFGKSPKDIHTMARQFQSDAAQEERDQRVAAAEGAKMDADSDLSKRYREHMRSLFTQLRMDPATISDSMPYAEIVDPNGAVQSALGERRAMASGGIRPGGAQGGLSAPAGGPISTGAGDIASPADAIAGSIKGAFPRGAEPENLDARIRQVMNIKDESQRKDAIAALEREGERMHKQLKDYQNEFGDLAEIGASLDQVGEIFGRYEGKDLPGSGIQALPTLIAQSLPVVGGEGSAAESLAKQATLSPEGREQMGAQELLAEAWGRVRSGASIGEVEGAKFKVQAALAKGATDQQIREGFSVLKNLYKRRADRVRAANPEGAEMYERNLAGRKPKGNLGELPPGVELVE